MKFSVLFITCGKGWAGSSPIGDSSGRTSRSKYSLTQARCAALRFEWLSTTMRARARAGMICSL